MAVEDGDLTRAASGFSHFFRFGLLRDLPAFEKAIATACFCGLPARISVAMFSLMTFLLDPDLSGMSVAALLVDLAEHLFVGGAVLGGAFLAVLAGFVGLLVSGRFLELLHRHALGHDQQPFLPPDFLPDIGFFFVAMERVSRLKGARFLRRRASACEKPYPLFGGCQHESLFW